VDVAAGLDHLDHSDTPAFVVVGVFDGLHLGHEYLLRHLVSEAGRLGARSMVITFDHHPDQILRGNAPPILCDPDERLDRLSAAGVDTTVVVHFDERLRETTYDAFVDMLAERVPLAGFLMTPDAAFGYRRAGTPEALAGLGRRRGFEVVVVPPFDIDGQPVRSTVIREAIASGELEMAARLLGRAHAVVGNVASAVPGVPREVRFPLPVALPPDGRYRVRVAGLDGDVSRAGWTDRAERDGSGGTADIVTGGMNLAHGAVEGRVRVAFEGRSGMG
jgi:riboflavin kinase/FMN adenylyltransferase